MIGRTKNQSGIIESASQLQTIVLGRKGVMKRLELWLAHPCTQKKYFKRNIPLGEILKCTVWGSINLWYFRS